MARDAAPLEGLDLNLLVTLRALLRESSVTRAAELLGQTQPTVSRSLGTLRAAFGDALLVRAGRGLAPTPFARSLRTPLERVLASVDRLSTVGAFDPTVSDRVFRLMMPDLLGILVAPDLARAVAAEAPDTTLQILGGEGDAVRALLDDEVDLVAAAPVFDHPELYTRRVDEGGIDWAVLFGPQHPVAGGPMSFGDWCTSTHVVLSPAGSPDTPSHLDLLLAKQGQSRRVGMHLGYVSALPGVLARTPWVASLPEAIARRLAEGTDLTVQAHPFDGLTPLPVRVTWHGVHHREPGLRWLRDRVADALRAALGRGRSSAGVAADP
jgi:DNA-binding transcriptional LysR family regulator